MDNNKPDTELDGAEIFSNWSQLTATESPESKTGSDILEMSLENLALDGGDAYWLKRFQETHLSDMDLVALKLSTSYTADLKAEATQIKIQSQSFLKQLHLKHMNELRIAGLSDDQIDLLKEGKLPINWTVHLKYPLAYGGAITIDNFVLIPHYPFHEDIHHFINQQIVTGAGIMKPALLYVPVPKSHVYVPYGSNDMTQEVVHFNQGGLR